MTFTHARFLLAAVLLLVPAVLFAQKTEGQGVIVPYNPTLKGPAEGMVSVLTKGPLNGPAQAAYGMYVQKAKISPAFAKNVITFSKRDGMMDEAIGILVANRHPNTAEIAKALASVGPYGLPLAAALYCANNQGVELAKRAQASVKKGAIGANAHGGAPDKAKGRKRPNPKLVVGKIAPVPTGLFTKSGSVQTMAILAAAYGKQANAKSIIEGLPNNPGIIGAKNLYLAMIGEIPSDDALKAGLSARGKFISRVNPILANLPLALPDAVTTMEAIGRLKNPDHLPIIHKMFSHPDLRVRIEAVRAAKAIGDDSSLPLLCKMLSTSPWPVVIEVCDALAQNPHKGSIRPLIEAYSKDRGRMRENMAYTLEVITDGSKGRDPRDWVSWYKREGAAFTVDEANSKIYYETQRIQDADLLTLVTFYGCRIRSAKFSFVVDSSASMRGARMYSLRENLYGTIGSMFNFINYNLIDFGGDVCVMYPNALANDKAIGKERALNMPMTLGTRTYDAMDTALKLPGLDSVVLLTDGAPVFSKAKSWSQMSMIWNLKTRYRQVAIHAIDFDPSAGNKRSMNILTNENCGCHESIEIIEADMVDEKFMGPKKKPKKKR